MCNHLLPFLATIVTQQIVAIFGNFEVNKILPFLATTVIRQIVAIFGNFEVNKILPYLATTVIRQIVAIFGNFVKQNIARNGKKVTEVLYRVADQSFYCHFWQLCAVFYCHFWQLLSYSK